MNKQTCGVWICGVATGIAVGLLFAPKTGNELRQSIKESARSKATGLQNQAAGLVDASAAALNEAKEAASRQRQRLQHAVEAGKEAYREVAG